MVLEKSWNIKENGRISPPFLQNVVNADFELRNSHGKFMEMHGKRLPVGTLGGGGGGDLGIFIRCGVLKYIGYK